MTFELKKLSELCTKITDGSHYSPKEVAGGVPMYSVKDMTQFGFSDATVKRISEDEYEALVKADCTPRVNDVLIAKDGSVLKHVFSIESEVRGALLSSIAILRPNLSLVDSDFLAYALQDPVLRSDVLSNYVSGSGVPRIVLKDFKNISIQTPKIAIQRRISKLLKSLDRKIQKNIAISETLEEISQTFFESWFVDFDPVKAKMVGEKPSGIYESTARLFPHSMEESERGLIPTGWILRSLDEISDYLNGLAMQKFPVIDELNTLPVIKIAQLRAGNTSGADVASGLLDHRYVINDGDILFSWSGTLEVEIWAGGPGALNQHLFKVTGASVPDWFSYLSTRHHLPMFRAIASGKATTMGHIQRGHLSEAKIAVPPKELLEAAHKILQPLLKLKLATLVSNRTLLELRDGLLPRLVSGELQIPEETLAS